MKNKEVKKYLQLALDEIYKEDLTQLVQNLHSDYFSKKEKLDILAWAERNLIFSIQLFEEFIPKYVYKEDNKKFLAGCSLIKDLKLNEI